MTPGELGLWLTLGAVVLLATVSAVLPLRGGHGQHAHAGPGTRTVDQLRGERVVLALSPPERSTRPPNEPGEAEIVWPTARDNHWLSPRHPSLVEEDLTELLSTGTGYVGRHRLDESRPRHEILPGTHLRAA